VLFAKDGATAPIQLVSSVIGQEGEQNGYYRILMRNVPSESPFLTATPGAFAWSALQMFVVPNSCPFPLSNIDLPIFPPLMSNGGATAAVEAKDQVISYSADLSSCVAAKNYVNGNGAGLYLTYITGQQLPISVGITNVKWYGQQIQFEANFPFSKNVMFGLSLAALTTSNNFDNAEAVANVTLAAPGIIQVANMV
jgi:hypothetical protein